MYTSRVSAFSFYLKKKTPAKEKQTRGYTPRPRQRRAAVLSLLLSISCSAHSPVNSLRSNNTDSCVLLRKPSPRSSTKAFKHCCTAIRSPIIKIARAVKLRFAKKIKGIGKFAMTLYIDTAIIKLNTTQTTKAAVHMHSRSFFSIRPRGSRALSHGLSERNGRFRQG